MLEKPLVVATALAKTFRRGRGLGAGVPAVDGVDIQIGAGEIVALVGESGSGKSTLGRLLLRLLEPTRGQVFFDGIDLAGLSDRAMRQLRRRMQIIFQDASSSLDPLWRVRDQVAEPLRIHHSELGAGEIERRVTALMDEVRLGANLMPCYPHELSGGQRQRVVIARALALSPEFLVADEPVSALDASVRQQVIELLLELQARRRLAMLFITHDLRVARRVSQRTLVMYGGRIVEAGSSESLFATPAHPYTRYLLGAAAETRRDGEGTRVGKPV
ncbi:MAG: ABC transporter ATP-binding protein [Acidobacteriota bacterium]